MTNDEYLLAALRLATGNDPIPGHVSRAAREAFGLRIPRVVTASPVESGQGCEVRESEGESVLRFKSDDVTLDLELSVSDGLIDVAGEIAPHPGDDSHVDIRTPNMTLTRRLIGSGQFAVTGMPPGWFDVVCHRPGHPPIATPWIRVRP
ncbi:hypothetical protein OIE66_08945 [Nonomuraea sp. NBC_01738]|uniref:hypothetical protein n=1 Tax=Nonomuraea sp. NBC_01738 TaxID=2976003 RepID=UPI002E10E1D1|nr:hypothetical protein OIE66_08945 [Nonomuraea sp. NBC_01738]